MKRKLLLFVPLLCLIACTPSKVSSSLSSKEESSVPVSSESNDANALQNALSKVGANYTIRGSDYSDFPFLTKITENAVYFDLLLETNGYVRLENDNNSYHWYKKVIQEKHHQEDFWLITGRQDISEEEFDQMRLLDKMIDVSTFTFDGEKYHSDDVFTNQNVLNLSSHTFSYALGFGIGGVDIYLEDSTISKIEVLGQGESDLDNSKVFTTMTITDIGTTKNEIIDDFIANGELPEPTMSDLSQVDRKGKPLYENETHTFDCLITGIYGGAAEQAAVSDLGFNSSFFVEDAAVLDPWSNYLYPMNITAKIIDSGKGYATLSEIVINSIESDCYDYECWTVDSYTYEEEFMIFPSLTGTPVSASLTYVDGTVLEEGEVVLKFQFNELYQVNVRIAETSEDARFGFMDFMDAGLETGEVVEFTGLIAHWNNGPEFLLSETASFEKALTPEEIILNAFGYSVPLPSLADGYDFLWNEIYEVNDLNYNGIFAKAFIKENDTESFVSSYKDELELNSYAFIETQVDADGDTFYIFIGNGEGTLIYFYEPLKMVYDDGSYYFYTLISIVDMTSPIVVEPEE